MVLVMDHLTDQYNGLIGSARMTWGSQRVGGKVDELGHVAGGSKSIGLNGRARQ